MNFDNISIDAYDYDLPDNLIARHPLACRDACRLLVKSRASAPTDHHFTDLVDLLEPDSTLVCNNTRVINARLRFRKGEDGSGALIEIFCLEPAEGHDFATTFASLSHCSWNCFVGNSKRWKQGNLRLTATLADGRSAILEARRKATGKDGVSVVEFSWSAEGDPMCFSEIIEAAGEIPIPPYLNRSTEQSDTTDYQTVFSSIEGSVAAPTAGLHFTPALLDSLAAKGIERRELTLHVGAGTFQPVKTDSIAEHAMHSEFIAVSRDLIAELATTERRIVAVGTTSVRTLESLYQLGCLASQGGDTAELPQWYAYSENHPRLTRRQAMEALLKRLDADGSNSLIASTRLLIAPGYDYKVVDAIITNFHQPRSTLLLLVSAFIGEEWRSVYNHALSSGYRFLSYGDACLFTK